MAAVIIVGCGVVGAMVAYELSQQPDLDITVLDQQRPAQGATGAALGILMGVISHKVKGRNWRLREASLRRYKTLLPELERGNGQPVPHNPQGIVSLCFDESELPRWESLQKIRQQQGWPLEIWSPQQLQTACPQVNLDRVVAAVYSSQDRQIAPKALTLALVDGAKRRGVKFCFDAAVTGFQRSQGAVTMVQAKGVHYPAEWVIVTAGLGSAALLQTLEQPLPLGPVLGQGLRVRVPDSLGKPNFQPVINGEDIHLVPLGDRQYAIAATVEFPTAEQIEPCPQADALEAIWKGAVSYCPALGSAEILATWYGLRPRPQGQGAPVVKRLDGLTNVIVATGHYRNGVLLAPATAQLVKDLLCGLWESAS